jgi:integrase
VVAAHAGKGSAGLGEMVWLDVGPAGHGPLLLRPPSWPEHGAGNLSSQQVQRVGGQLVRRHTKTDSSEAPLPLPDFCVTALKVRKQEQDADRERAGDAWIDTGLVFTTRHGTPVEPRNFNRSFDRRIGKADVPKITVHGTRKTCGSLLAALDIHPRVAMQILRHSKTAVTMEIYTEIPSAATREALRKLGRWLDS